MEYGVASLQDAIAAHLAEWEQPLVELAIHGTGDARTIAHAIDSICLSELGTPIEETLFYRSSA